MVKASLSQKGVTYRDRDVSVDQSAARELQQRTGRMAVPVIIVDDQTIIGFDRARLEQVLGQAQAARPTFGAAVADASSKVTGQSGAYVGKVRPGSAAERAGLAAWDIITEMNHQPISSAGDLESALSKLGRGSRFSIVYLRGGKSISIDGTL